MQFDEEQTKEINRIAKKLKITKEGVIERALGLLIVALKIKDEEKLEEQKKEIPDNKK